MKKYPFDTSVRPQDDYFGYVNNRWLADNPIPSTESVWGAFNILRDNALDSVHEILDELQSIDTAALSHDQQLLRSFYQTATHFNDLSPAHSQTIHRLMSDIDAIKTSADLARYIGHAHRRDQSPFWTLYIDSDDKDSSIQVLRFHQSGLTLPNRDYYLDTDERSQLVRQEYASYYTDMQSLAPAPTGEWSALIDLETRIATASWTNVALRDVHKNYTRMTLADLKATYAFDWDTYFDALGWQAPCDDIVIGQPPFLAAMCEILATTPLDTLKVYLRWHLYGGLTSWISGECAARAFAFFGTILSGVKEMKPTWKRALMQIDASIVGEALGREYAARHFPESSKKEVLAIVEDIRAAYHERISHLTWMSDPTKTRAHTKLDAIHIFIGYPSVWKDFTKLVLGDTNHLENIIRMREFRTNYDLVRIGQKPADEEWEMNAHTVNAYHHPNRLEIVFPAAILQPPFYEPTASYASNLGGIGAVIGHEFTHGFDDQGADFDERGIVDRWQTDEERAAFDALAQHIVAQADAYETIPGTHLQGKLILGEAIADVGGLQLAVTALTSKTSDNERTTQLRDLFVNFAMCECGHATLERLEELAKTDPHPPSPFRINCVVNHIDAFYEIYDVKAGDTLYLAPEKRSQIW